MTRRRKLSLIIAALLLLLGATVWWLVASEPGLRFVWGRVHAWSPVPIAGEVHGRLLGPLRVDRLEIQARNGGKVEVASADLDWVPWGVMEGRLMFSRADLHQVVVTAKPRATGTGAVHVPAPPMPIDLRGTVDGLTVNIVSADAPPRRFHLDRVGVDAVAGPAHLKARALSLDGYGVHLELEGEASLRVDGPIKATTRWSWQPPQGERLRGHGTLTGTLARPRTEQAFDEVAEGTARGSLVWLDQPLHWQAQVMARPINIARLDRRARPVVAGGEVRAEGNGGGLRMEAEGTLQDASLGAWKFKGEGSQVPEGWRLPLVSLAAADGRGQVSASGFLYTRGAASVALDLAWSGFPVTPGAFAASPSGQVTVKGSLDDYQVAGSARLARVGLPDGEAELAGHGDRHSFEVTELDAAWMEGQVGGTGRVQWLPRLAWNAELEARDLNPGRWRADFPGRVSARIASRGERGNKGLVAELSLEQVSGTLRNNPVSGRGRFQWENDLLRVQSLELVNGTAHLTAEGELGARWDLRTELNAEKVQDLVPGIAGRLQAEVRVNGPRDEPWLRAEATGSELTWKWRRASRLNLKASIDLAGTNPWDVRLLGEGLQLGTIQLDHLDVGGQGSPADHLLTLDAGAEGRTLHLEAHGAWASRHWEGQLAAGRMEDPRLGSWVQAAPAPLAVDRKSVRLGQWCWSHEGGSLCAGMVGGAGQEWSGEADLRAFPAAAFQPLLGQGFQLTGMVDGHASFRFLDELTALNLDLAATAGAFRFQMAGGDAVTTPYERVDLRLRAGNQGFQGQADLDLANGDHARARFALPRWRPGQPFSADQPLRGSAQASLGELVWVSLLVPDLVPSGRLEGQFNLAGTLGRPLVEGEAALANGELAVPILGISIADLRFALHAEGPDAMTLTATARSGPGRLTVNGRATAQAEGWIFDLKVAGDTVEVANLPQVHIFATPDLQATVSGTAIRLRGSVLIPRARIDLPEIVSPVQASGDVVIVDQPESEARRRRWTLSSEITLRFGDDVKISGYGFAGRLAGELMVVEPEGGGAVGRGELQILEGKYTAYGQNLTIEEGRLLYGSAPLNNPGIQFKAVRQIDEEVKVGVMATGRLKKPEVRLYSEPAMDDTQVLAYLVLGRPLETVTQDESATLQRAAVSLGLVGGGELARRIGDQAGLDVVNVQPVQNSGTTTTQNIQVPAAGSATGTGTTTSSATATSTSPYQASLVLGKYLSPRLYVQYAVGLWDTGNAWQMRYLLDKNWTIKAESGVQSGVDLLYTIEK